MWESLVAAGVGLYSADKAASAQSSAATQAATATEEANTENIEFQKWLFDQQKELQKPYYDTGVAALPMLQARAGIVTPTQAPSLQKIPRYTSDEASKINNVYDYVSNLYIEGLGREGKPENIDNWVSKIADGTYDKNSVVSAFMDEAESTGVSYNQNNLTEIQKALKVENSLMATNKTPQNALVQKDTGENGYGEETVSEMNPNSHFASFSFQPSLVDKEEIGKSSALGFATGGVVGGIAAGLATYGKQTISINEDQGGFGTDGYNGFSKNEMTSAGEQSDSASNNGWGE